MVVTWDRVFEGKNLVAAVYSIFLSTGIFFFSFFLACYVGISISFCAILRIFSEIRISLGIMCVEKEQYI